MVDGANPSIPEPNKPSPRRATITKCSPGDHPVDRLALTSLERGCGRMSATSAEPEAMKMAGVQTLPEGGEVIDDPGQDHDEEEDANEAAERNRGLFGTFIVNQARLGRRTRRHALLPVRWMIRSSGGRSGLIHAQRYPIRTMVVRFYRTISDRCKA